jgi:hypothetical protein
MADPINDPSPPPHIQSKSDPEAQHQQNRAPTEQIQRKSGAEKLSPPQQNHLRRCRNKSTTTAGFQDEGTERENKKKTDEKTRKSGTGEQEIPAPDTWCGGRQPLLVAPPPPPVYIAKNSLDLKGMKQIWGWSREKSERVVVLFSRERFFYFMYNH